MDVDLMKKIVDKYVWKATIVKHTYWIAVGVAFKKEIKEGHFVFEYQGQTNSNLIKRNYYLISYNGYKWYYF